jgi:carotenoid cleavage dioxygenase-like enzyme
MAARLVHRYNSSIAPNTHPYLNGAWTPNTDEFEVDQLLALAGAVPADMPDGIATAHCPQLTAHSNTLS